MRPDSGRGQRGGGRGVRLGRGDAGQLHGDAADSRALQAAAAGRDSGSRKMAAVLLGPARPRPQPALANERRAGRWGGGGKAGRARSGRGAGPEQEGRKEARPRGWAAVGGVWGRADRK